jgi:hypothetical protein
MPDGKGPPLPGAVETDKSEATDTEGKLFWLFFFDYIFLSCNILEALLSSSISMGLHHYSNRGIIVSEGSTVFISVKNFISVAHDWYK